MAGLAAALALSACGAGGGAGGGGVVCDSEGTRVGGTVWYEDRVYDAYGFTGRRAQPVRRAKVELINPATGALVYPSPGITDDQGNFCFRNTALPEGTKVAVRAYASADVGGVTVRVFDSRIGQTYFVDSEPQQVKVGDYHGFLVPIRLTTTWDLPGAYSDYISGAYNILDVVSRGIQFVQEQWNGSLTDLKVSWNASAGGGTYFDRTNGLISISGYQSGDSNEYDDDIILHEVGHYVFTNLARDSSPGGTHYINGYTEDTRLAWSEGWATFFSAMVRDVRQGWFSNLSGQRSSMVDSLVLTEGTLRALRFSYELDGPSARLPDQNSAAYDPAPVDAVLFENLVKGETSEVSVSAALWDIYAGGSNTFGESWPGIGAAGIGEMVRDMAADYGASTVPVAMSEFLGSFARRYQGRLWLDAVFRHLVEDRRMSTVDDLYGLDDSIADVANLSSKHHLQASLAQSAVTGSHTLYAADGTDDADVFHLTVTTDGTYAVETFDLNDGADTYLELLDADGNVLGGGGAFNDNWQPYEITVRIARAGQPDLVGTYSSLDHADCKTIRFFPEGAGPAEYVWINTCPPNAANPPPHAAFWIPDYLASKVELHLMPGQDYYVRVTRSPNAAPSAGRHGAYRLRVWNTLNPPS